MTLRHPHGVALCGALLSLSVALSSSAEPSASDKAAAEALFQQGQKLIKQKNFAEACPKFEASEQLDPAVGTLLYLGDCYEQIGRTASAWATFNEAQSLASSTGQGSRAKIAQKRIEALEPKLRRLTISVAPEVASTPGFELKRDGATVPKGTFGAPIPVDPGEHQIDATATGKKPWHGTVKVDGPAAELSVPALEEEPVAAPPPVQTTPPPTAARPPVASPPPKDSGETSGGSSQATFGFVLGGVGIVGLAVGGVFGLQAKSKNDDSLDQCRPAEPNQCTADGKALRDDARSAATISTISFIGGGVLLAGGIVLLLTAPSGKERAASHPTLHLSTTVGPRSAGLSLGGSF